MNTQALFSISLIVILLTGCAGERSSVPLGDGLPSVSSPLALSPDGQTLWVVNPDADSVTPVDVQTLTAGTPVPVGREPWSVAVTPAGTVVVMNRLDGSLSLLDGHHRTDLPIGPEPGGVALSPSGRLAYVTVSSADQVAVVDVPERKVIERIPVDRLPWAIAVTDNGDADDDDEAIIVTHRLARLRPDGQEARNDGKEGWLTVLQGGEVSEHLIAPYDFGYPNVMEGLAISGDQAYVVHLLNRPELPRDFENTISGALSAVSLGANHDALLRLHINDADFSTPVNYPRAVAITPDGHRAFLVLAGSDTVMGIDLADPENPRLLGFWPTGKNPRGVILNREGTRAFVMNYLSRDVSVLDVADTVRRRERARISVVGETLAAELIRGKILFNNASYPRLSHLGWISCASCHPGGGADNTTWVTPEGHRQTMPLWDLEGTAPFHISATRDELQDFEDDIETLMRGIGLAPGPVNPLLGEPNGGTSADLDALARFVLTGIRVPRAAKPDPAAIERGREVFIRAGCAACHGGPKWTRSSLPGPVGTLAPNGELEVEAVLHEVGTYNPETDILGEKGFDIPTLLGLHATAPYLHDGSAATLEQVLANPRHVGADLSAAERKDLTVFLRSIDDLTLPIDE